MKGFKIELKDKELMKKPGVRAWLRFVEKEVAKQLKKQEREALKRIRAMIKGVKVTGGAG